MTRRARDGQAEIEMAMRLAATAETATQLRQSQSILLPALAGASLDVTAAILGVSRSRLGTLRRQFKSGGALAAVPAKHGGRRRALMSVEEEKRFLAPWLDRLRNGEGLPVAKIASAYQQAIGHPVPKSTIYRLLARHGWRRTTVRRGSS